MTPSKMDFEKRYSDDSGVEFAVRYTADTPGDLAQIEFECVRSVIFPIDQLDWIIAALTKIRDEHKSAGSLP